MTPKLRELPGLTLLGAVTKKWVGAAVPTEIEPEVPVIEAVSMSVAVMVWCPSVFSVAKKSPVPLDRVEFAGSDAWASVLVKCTVPL